MHEQTRPLPARFPALVLALALALVLAGCGGGGGNEEPMVAVSREIRLGELETPTQALQALRNVEVNAKEPRCYERLYGNFPWLPVPGGPNSQLEVDIPEGQLDHAMRAGFRIFDPRANFGDRPGSCGARPQPQWEEVDPARVVSTKMVRVALDAPALFKPDETGTDWAADLGVPVANMRCARVTANRRLPDRYYGDGAEVWVRIELDIPDSELALARERGGFVPVEPVRDSSAFSYSSEDVPCNRMGVATVVATSADANAVDVAPDISQLSGGLFPVYAARCLRVLAQPRLPGAPATAAMRRELDIPVTMLRFAKDAGFEPAPLPPDDDAFTYRTESVNCINGPEQPLQRPRAVIEAL